ncbi:hypothetical protein GCM10009801_17320 [Streptomyces albiaxialis]|uniref:PsrA tetracyclin repressor-like C-terminal domain-containing protein n=1 Tax=Streptomyces albiaxialis TaxID=329523 RepID=A0ABP5H9I7_9ACTN
MPELNASRAAAAPPARVGPAEGRYLAALTAALPQLSPREVAFRYRAMVGLLGLYQSGVLADLHPGRSDSDSADGGSLTVEEETEALVALLTAAVTGQGAERD